MVSDTKQTFIFDNGRTDKRDIYWVDMQPPFKYNGELVQVIDIRWKKDGMIYADTITLTLKGFKNNMKAFLLGGRATYGILKRVVKQNEERIKKEHEQMEIKGLSKIELLALKAVAEYEGKNTDELIKDAVLTYIEQRFEDVVNA